MHKCKSQIDFRENIDIWISRVVLDCFQLIIVNRQNTVTNTKTMGNKPQAANAGAAAQESQELLNVRKSLQSCRLILTLMV